MAKRCQDFIRRGQKTPYASTYDDIRKAAKYSRRAIMSRPTNFNNDLRRTKEGKVFVLRASMNKSSGYAVDCKKFSARFLVDIPSFGMQLYFGPSGSYHNIARSIIRKRKSQPGGWFLLTSHPSS